MNRTTLANVHAPRKPTPEQEARAERKAHLEAFCQSEEWQQLVTPCLQAQRRRAMESMAANPQLTERELREFQARCALLLSLIARPVDFLMQCYDGKGDE